MNQTMDLLLIVFFLWLAFNFYWLLWKLFWATFKKIVRLAMKDDEPSLQKPELRERRPPAS